MHRIDTTGNVGGLFADPDPIHGQVPVIWDAAYANDLQENIIAVIAAASIALVKGNYGQLLAAINALILTQVLGDGTFAIDTGSVNAVVATLSPTRSTAQGLSVKILISHTNTGPATFNQGGSGAIAIQQGGAALPANALIAGQVAELVDDGTHWELISQTSAVIAAEIATAQAAAVATAEAYALTLVRPVFVSAANALALTTEITVAHGLTNKPFRAGAYIECLTAENGYSVGDRVEIPFGLDEGHSGGPISVMAVSWDASDVYLTIYSTTSLTITTKGASTQAGLTLANWAAHLWAESLS